MKKKLTAADMHDPQVIAETQWFSMRKVGIDVAPGERRDFYSIHYPRPAVGIVAIQDEKVLLIRHYRYLIDQVVWAIPSGVVEEGEDPAVAALRELREETGLTEESLEELRLRYITLRMKNGEIRQNYYFFAGLEPGAAVRGTCDEGRLEWVPYDSVLKREMPFTAKTVLRHYLRVGCRTRCIYGSVTEAEDSAITELAEY